ncbi:uncharacterized protein LOC103310671 [Acyrthosiphon pisum]|uniref:Uncharacterized protein n=1 Tax=Acyrthosiphon pisum TaxID=7029 RepID=A0A8R2B998_ACYPI|nr:uncharacterized protein LOC103310671 [Acyrthosiphon pisum]|eukprot:XP_008187933.1 PREDICTED: uncharacterized protein LOC103310671 [Acyrthosiphon pisum]
MARVYTVHPSQIEYFHLRLLLHHVQCPTSFDFLKTLDGDLHPTFKSAFKALGLLEEDNQWKYTLVDASFSQSSEQISDLFAIILGFCYPSDPCILWETFKKRYVRGYSP